MYRIWFINLLEKKMGKYNTNYFGEISIDETRHFESCYLKYNGQNLHIIFSDCNIYGNKLNICLDILDKYIEINEIGKKAILKKFFSEKLEELNYPDLHFFIKNNEINFFLEYGQTSLHKKFWERFNKAYKQARAKGIMIDPAVPPPFCVEMDGNLNILKVSRYK
jgi:hypothetical protein